MNSINFANLKAYSEKWRVDDILVFEKLIQVWKHRTSETLYLNKKAMAKSLHIGRYALEAAIEFLERRGYIMIKGERAYSAFYLCRKAIADDIANIYGEKEDMANLEIELRTKLELLEVDSWIQKMIKPTKDEGVLL